MAEEKEVPTKRVTIDADWIANHSRDELKSVFLRAVKIEAHATLYDKYGNKRVMGEPRADS